MATRSNIGILYEDGSVRMSYSHWDGYPSVKGRMLLTHYTCPEKIENLIDLGASSTLEAEIIPKGKQHSYNFPEPNVTVFYHRDRKEDWDHCAPLAFKDVEEAKRNMEEYLYLWDGEKWLYSDHKQPLAELTMEICEKD